MRQEFFEEYEARIAALEERMQSFQAAIDAETAAQSRFSWKDQLEKYGLLVAWVLLILVLGIFRPDQMFSWPPYATMFGSQAMVVILTLGLIIPLTAGDFDLSIASVMTLSSMLVAVFNVQMGLELGPTIFFCLAIGAMIGLINAFFTLYFRIHSLIVTLGVGYFINGMVLWVSNSNTITGVSMNLIEGVILTRLLGVPIAFYYGLILTLIIWYVFEYTSVGRRLLFVGKGAEVARLSGVNLNRMRTGAFVASAIIGAFAGILYTGMRGAADPTSGLAFLLPAFAAAFLGSTAISPGRFNAIGAFVAVYFLSTGIMGLNFLGVDTFVQNLFYGGGLVLAVAISQLIRNRQPM
jgi:ribose transport system permease protein